MDWRVLRGIRGRRNAGTKAGWFQRAWVAAVVTLVFACGENPLGITEEDPEPAASEPPPPESLSVNGSWQLDLPGCVQTLVLREDGTFMLAARFGLSDSFREERLAGEFAIVQDAGGGGPFLQITAVDEVKPGVAVYCEQWARRGETQLAFEEILEETGIALESLITRTEVSEVLGKILVGSDSSRTDRFALWLAETGEITGVAMTDDFFGLPFYSAHFSDSNHWLGEFENREVVNFPQGTLSASFEGITAGNGLLQRVLNVTAASDVTVSRVRDTNFPLCNLAIFAETDFVNLVTNFIFDSGAEQGSFSLNPNDPSQFFLQAQVGPPEDQATGFFLPLRILAPDSENCSIHLNAKPAVVSALEARVAEGGAQFFSIVSPGPSPLRVEAGAPGSAHLLLEAFPSRLAKAAASPRPQLISLLPLLPGEDGSRPYFDLLDLLLLEETGARVSLGSGEEGTLLTLFDSRPDSAGLGPFVQRQRPSPQATLSPPASTESDFGTEGASQAFLIEMESSGRLVLWSEGGAQTEGRLFDSEGLVLAEGRSGAPDGAGFQIVASMPPGSYDLVMTHFGGPTAFTVRVEHAEDLVPFADDALAACVLEAGWASGGKVAELSCFGRGVETLVGLETLVALQSLDLAGNELTDVTPLQGLTELRRIALDNNQVSDIAPLAELFKLRRLSLAGNPIDPEQLLLLGELAARLTHLDLSGVTTLTQPQAEQLRQLSGGLLLILPDGTVVE